MIQFNEQGYSIEKICDGVIAIDSKKSCSSYLLEGDDSCILIDTGMKRQAIRPLLKTLTKKPIDLALTHLHIDHIFHAGEFDNVYLHEDEQKNWDKKTKKTTFLGAIGYGLPIRKYNVKNYIPLKEGETLPLKGRDIKVYRLQGHTPGSCIFVDLEKKLVFTGDAIGCGIGVWMWLSDTVPVAEYKTDLCTIRDVLEPYKHFIFLSGHREQAFQKDESKTPIPFGFQTIVDMIELCDLVIEKKISPTKSERAFIFTIHRYDYKTASMWLK